MKHEPSFRTGPTPYVSTELEDNSERQKPKKVQVSVVFWEGNFLVEPGSSDDSLYSSTGLSCEQRVGGLSTV